MSLNKVQLIGYLGRKPEVRYMQSGDAVANVSIAMTEKWKDRQSGQQREHTEWMRLVFFRKLAEVVERYLGKGSQIYVEGRLRTRQWERNGEKHYTTEVVVDNLQMLDRRAESSGNDWDNGSAGRQESDQENDFGSPPPEDFDDDIPF